MIQEIETISEMELNHMLKAWLVAKGNIKKASRLLDISRATFYRRLKTHGIDIHELGAESLRRGIYGKRIL